jgi:hypothetical protein
MVCSDAVLKALVVLEHLANRKGTSLKMRGAIAKLV